jgi:predicted secreted protein
MAGIDGFGTALARSDMASSPTFTEIANVTSISGPGISRETIDVTAHDSPDGWREFLGGLKDGGEVSFDLNWDVEEPTHEALVSDLEDSVPRDYKLVFPNDIAEWAFKAILTGFEASFPTDDKITASVTYKISGKPVLTVGSSSS